jgi:nitroreductase
MSHNEEFPSPEATMALLKGRRSIRQYTSDPVPDDLIEQVLEAGRWAPSASNRQPWHFIVIREPEIRAAVAEHAAYYFIRWAHVEEAPVIIALCGDRKHRVYQQFLHEDIGLAGGQMMLAAAALGLGTCWIGGLDREALSAILKLPEHIELVGMLTLGFPAEDPDPPGRKPLEQIVHYGTYGNQEPGAAKAGALQAGPLSVLLRKLRIRF